MDDFLNGLVLVALFPCLDEIRVLNTPCGIEHHLDAILVGQLGNSFDISHGNRLSARQVNGHCETDIWNLISAHFVNQGLELIQVNIALEIKDCAGVMGLVDNHIAEGCAVTLLMETCGGEIHVAWYIIPRLDGKRGKDILCAASLVGRHHILKSEQLLYRCLKVIEVLGSAVGFIT